MPRSMLFESGFAARKQLGNPIEGCVDANSATCLINFFLEALGHCVHPPNPFVGADLRFWLIPRLLSGE
ncbi:MAG: hypothetical protein Udaeo2_02320 [Candidatus Udaeobacter sp.]|nr:MAG: hypothetical protein Udaeo2_02320 [Candidatus Udaeobacter sp.]